MEFDIQYWHWLVLGLALISLEVFVPSFVTLWFGLGAVFVGILCWVLPDLPTWAQILIWAVDSTVLVLIWFLLIQPRMLKNQQKNLSLERIQGETGSVKIVPTENRKGVVRFTTPLCGSDEWDFESEDTLRVGDRVKIVDFDENTLKVVLFN